MPNKFVIYCFPRTGSYHLTSLLDSCSDVSCYGELFKPGVIELPAERRRMVKAGGPVQRDKHPLDFIEKVRLSGSKKIFGFKVFQQHVKRVPKLKTLFGRISWKKVILYREPVETYASVLRAQATNIWTLKEDASVDPEKLNVKVTFTPESWKRFRSSYSTFLRNCARIAERPGTFVIRYDQLNDPGCLAELLRFLGSEESVASLTSRFKKQYSGTVADSFLNWSELQGALASEPSFPEPPPPTFAGSMSPEGAHPPGSET